MNQRTKCAAVRKPHKPKPSLDETTHILRDPVIVVAEKSRFDALAKRKGSQDRALKTVVNIIAAAGEWIADNYDNRQAYGLLTDVAEAMIESLLEPPEEVDA